MPEENTAEFIRINYKGKLVIVGCATENTTRNVADVMMFFYKAGDGLFLD